jgi:glycosyltransferase involved in cell wall biosynthesis
MLNVAHFTFDIDGRSNSGTARVARELIEELSKQEDIFQTLFHFRSSNESIYSLPRVNEVVINLGSNWITRRRSISFLKWCFQNLILKGTTRFDVVHWHSSRLFPFFFLFPSKKIVVTLHDIGPRIIPKVNTFATRMFYWNLRIFQFKTHKIIASSKMAMENMKTIGKLNASKLEYVYLGTNFGSLQANPPKNFKVPDTFLICVSRWQLHKNVSSFIVSIKELMPLLVESKIEIVLVGKPVGNYDLPAFLIKDLSLDQQVKVLQDLTDENIAYLYDHALLNVFPSVHEGFGLSVAEGMTRGCVPVIHESTATSEVAGACGIKVDMTNIQSIVEVLTNSIKNPESWKKKKDLAKKISEQYTWSQAAIRVREIYEKD